MRSLGLDLGGTNMKLALLDGRCARSSSARLRRSPSTARRRCSARIVELGRTAGDGRLDRRRSARALRRRRSSACSCRTSTATGRACRFANPWKPAFGRAGAPDQRRSRVRAGRGVARCRPWSSGRDVHRLRHGDRRRPRARREACISGAPSVPASSGTTPSSRTGRSATAATAAVSSSTPALAPSQRRGRRLVRRGGRARAPGRRDRRGGPRARRDVDRAAVANVLIFIAPERVVLGGGVAEAGALLLTPLRTSIAERARVAPLDEIAIVTAELGPVAGAIGAALWGAEPA